MQYYFSYSAEYINISHCTEYNPFTVNKLQTAKFSSQSYTACSHCFPQTRNNNTWCVHMCVREPLYMAFSISLKSLRHYMCMFSCTVRICVVVHVCISVWRLINSQDRNTQSLPDYKFYNWGLHALCMQKPQLGAKGGVSMSVAVEAEINCSTD